MKQSLLCALALPTVITLIALNSVGKVMPPRTSETYTGELLVACMTLFFGIALIAYYCGRSENN